MSSERRAAFEKRLAEYTKNNDVPQLSAEERAELDDFDRQLDALLEAFPEEERYEASMGLYLDAEGNPQTRYGRFRSV